MSKRIMLPIEYINSIPVKKLISRHGPGAGWLIIIFAKHCFEYGPISRENAEFICSEELKMDFGVLEDAVSLGVVSFHEGYYIVDFAVIDRKVYEDKVARLKTNSSTNKKNSEQNQHNSPISMICNEMRLDEVKLNDLKLDEVKKKKGFDFEMIQYPDGLDTPEVRKMMVEWIEYRKEIRKPYKSTSRLNLALGDFIGHLPETLIQSMRDSIKHGWQGLFVPKSNVGGLALTGATKKVTNVDRALAVVRQFREAEKAGEKK